MAKVYAEELPVFTRSPTGVPANHSSTEKSVAPLDHAQSDDALQDIPAPQDPNISGRAPTKDCYPWRAGQMSAWQENDDYRTFFEAGHVADPSLHHKSNYPIHDGDYDDNRGIPTHIGHHDVMPGEDPPEAHLEQGTLPSADEFPLGPVIRKRI